MRGGKVVMNDFATSMESKQLPLIPSILKKNAGFEILHLHFSSKWMVEKRKSVKIQSQGGGYMINSDSKIGNPFYSCRS